MESMADQPDLEAASHHLTAIGRSASGKDCGPREPGSSLLKDRIPVVEDRQDEQTYRMSQLIADRLLQSIKSLVRSELRDSENLHHLLPQLSAGEQSVAGAKEITAETRSLYGEERNSQDKGDYKESNSGCQPLLDPPFQPELQHKHQENLAQQADQNVQPRSDYKQKVRVMSIEEIKAEDGRRSALRERWRVGEELAKLEDPWKNLWRADKDNSEPLFRGCSNEERIRLEAELIDALYFTPCEHRFDLIPSRGLRALSCWVSFIGLRLSDLLSEAPYSPTDSPETGGENSAAFLQVQVLVECIWACNTSSSARVGDVLGSCYRRRVFRQPGFDSVPESNSAAFSLRIQFHTVRVAIYLINLLFKHKEPFPDRSEDLKKTWSMAIPAVEVAMRDNRRQRVVVDAGMEPFLTASDLNLKDLQTFGRLQIQWTGYWDEHLELETKRSVNIFKLYWFSPDLSEFFAKT